MADVSHLDRMGRELKCPICLSLFSSAVSLTCNHVFCESCIQKCMKSDNCCPVCKVPFSRREVRPAPHMENLVQIYKSMETASGMNIFVTQDTPPTKSSDEGKADGGSNDRNTECSTKGKKSKLKSSGSKPVRPSFRTNKRVQVPKTPLPETPIRLETSEPDAMNCEPNSELPNDYTSLNGNSNQILRPLFWLREDVEKLSQSTNKEHLTLTPVDIPNFSDIKDSDDDIPDEVSMREAVSAKQNVASLFDSEMFEWTQRAGSPELCSTPIKIQNVIKGSSDNVSNTCLKGGSSRSVIKVISEKVKIPGKASGCCESRKRTRNVRTKNPSKGTKKNQASHVDQLEEPVDKALPTAPCTEKISRKRKNSKSNQCQTKLQEKPALQECEGRISDLSKSSTEALGEKKSSIRVDNKKCKRKIDVSTNAESADPMGPHHSMKAGSVMRKCQSNLNRSICGFCHSAEETELSGEMINYVHGKPVSSDFIGESSIIHSHKNCTEWAPNVFFEDDIAINLEAELARSRRIKCSLCWEKGASLGCYDKSCRRSFHVPCAKRLKQSRWDTDNFVMLCPLHSSSKLPNEQPEYQVKRKNNPKRTHSQSAMQTSQWDSRDKLHLCFSALTAEEKEIVTKFKRLSGSSVSKNWNTSITHVIASTDENGACKRTLKVLMGILEGKWILSIEWIKACLNARKVVDESTYEINVDSHGMKGGPTLGRLRLVNKQPKIFGGLSFYLCGDFEPSYKGYLNDLIIAAGGNILHRKPIVEDKVNLTRDESLPSTVIVYSREVAVKNDMNKHTILKGRKVEAEAIAETSGCMCVSNLWVLNCISGYRLLSPQSSMI